jgi:hypothetical protein
MRVLELKVPPPAVALVTAVLMWLVSRAAPALALVFPTGSLFAVGGSVPQSRKTSDAGARR